MDAENRGLSPVIIEVINFKLLRPLLVRIATLTPI